MLATRLIVEEALEAECQDALGRDLSKYEIVYLFIDGTAKRIRLG